MAKHIICCSKSLIIFASVALMLGCNSTSKSSLSRDERQIDRKVDSLLNLMTLEEKIGQTVLYTSDWAVTGPALRQNYIDDIRSGRCGNIFNAYTVDYVRNLQQTAVEQTRLGIPLLFGYDVIHGFRTIFPISLGEAASWDMEAVELSAKVASAEAAASGLNWTFAPMCDITVDPRWGRVSEGAGEDPFLGSEVARARVRGIQGGNLADTLTLLACVKHFAAYGAPQAGRDYNTVDMSRRVFLDTYLPPYKAAIEEGAMSVMTSFNEFDGIPATGNRYLMTELLRDELHFKGLVVTDYTSMNEMVNHGVVANGSEAAALSLNAGVDMDMQGELYSQYLAQLIGDGSVSESALDEAVRRVLKVKYLLGLFDDPYRYMDNARQQRVVYAPENLAAAQMVAEGSFVLLKNDKNTLPLSKGTKIAVIGELAASSDALLGSWRGAGESSFNTSLLDELRAYNGYRNVIYSEGCKSVGNDRSGFNAALRAARSADAVVLVIGENCNWTGEAASRTSIQIPGVQTDLLAELKKTGKPIAVVLMNGRPLDLSREAQLADAMLECWYAGTMGGKAITRTLFGEVNPSGKLPITFPRNVGQVPLYYYAKNTGRPDYLPDPKYKSIYLDSPNTPLYAFGYGLSYTSFDYSPIELSDDEIALDGTLTASVTVTNSGDREGTEVVQCYVRDLVGSVTRPVKELKGFERITLAPRESRKVEFTVTPDMLEFHRADMSYGAERGDFELFIGTCSDNTQKTTFRIK